MAKHFSRLGSHQVTYQVTIKSAKVPDLTPKYPTLVASTPRPWRRRPASRVAAGSAAGALPTLGLAAGGPPTLGLAAAGLRLPPTSAELAAQGAAGGGRGLGCRRASASQPPRAASATKSSVFAKVRSAGGPIKLLTKNEGCKGLPGPGSNLRPVSFLCPYTYYVYYTFPVAVPHVAFVYF